MLKTISYFSILSLCLLSMACTRAVQKESSRLSLLMPDHPQVSAKGVVTAGSGVGVCYFMTVNGAGIAPNGSTCSPATGISTGALAPLAPANLEVPSGQVDVDIYLLLLTEGETCVAIGQSLAQHSPNRLYWMGGKKAVNATGGEVRISIDAQFPGLPNHLARARQMPAACVTAANPVAASNELAGHMAGNIYSVKGHFAGVGQAQAMSGSTYSMKLTRTK